MTDDQIARIANAVHDRLMNGPLKQMQRDMAATKSEVIKLGNHLTRLEGDMKGVKESVEHLSEAWDNWQGAV